MSLTSGAYRVHSLFQNIIPTPYAVDPTTYQLIKSIPHQKRFHKTFRISILLSFFLFFIPFCFGRFIWLLHHWKSYTVYHVDQIIVYIFYLTATFLFIPACWTQHKKCTELIFVLNQRCKLINIKTHNSASSAVLEVVNFSVHLPFIGKSSIKEIVIYCLSSACFIVILGVTALPFAITYDPVQLVIERSAILVKIFIYWSFMIFAGTSILSVLLKIIVFLEGILYYSTSIHFHRCPFSTWMRFKFK